MKVDARELSHWTPTCKCDGCDNTLLPTDITDRCYECKHSVKPTKTRKPGMFIRRTDVKRSRKGWIK